MPSVPPVYDPIQAAIQDIKDIKDVPTPVLAKAVITEVNQLRKDIRKLLALGLIGALMVAISITGTFFSWKSSQTNGKLLRLAQPLLTEEVIRAARHRGACLPILAAGGRPEICDDVLKALQAEKLIPVD